jgi:hypothetical protein
MTEDRSQESEFRIHKEWILSFNYYNAEIFITIVHVPEVIIIIDFRYNFDKILKYIDNITILIIFQLLT